MPITSKMAGQVLEGRFAGQALEALSQEQLLGLLNDFVGEDDESAALLRAYLDRTYGPDWHEASREDGNTEDLFGEMTRSAAYAILGLEEGASEEQIIAAHGRLIQRLHPDRGGSTFLAAKIKTARFYAENILPQAAAEAAVVMTGAQSTLALADDDF